MSFVAVTGQRVARLYSPHHTVRYISSCVVRFAVRETEESRVKRQQNHTTLLLLQQCYYY